MFFRSVPRYNSTPKNKSMSISDNHNLSDVQCSFVSESESLSELDETTLR